MRTIIFSIICFLTYTLSAQEGIKTTTFTVKGNCEDCKERIENAADIKGVKILKWDPETRIASVTYHSGKTDLSKIKTAIAAAGYDAGEIAGDDSAYKKLPKCCQYRDGKCEEPSR